jgi:hypothetical protein
MKPDITKYDPCKEGLLYYNSFETFEDAWNNCPRGDWMLWIASKLDIDINRRNFKKIIEITLKIIAFLIK